MMEYFSSIHLATRVNMRKREIILLNLRGPIGWICRRIGTVKVAVSPLPMATLNIGHGSGPRKLRRPTRTTMWPIRGTFRTCDGCKKPFLMSLAVRDLEQVQNQSAVIATRKGAASLMSETKSMLVISWSGKGFSQVLLNIRSDLLCD